MKKFILALIAGLISASSGFAQLGYTPTSVGAYCLHAGSWIPIQGAINGTALGYTPQFNGLFALNGSSWYGLACDSSGNLVISGTAASISVGTTNVASGTTNYLLYNNGGVLGNTTALPSITTATTQIPVDISNSIATDLFANSQIARAKSTSTVSITGGTYNTATAGTGAVINWTATGGAITSIGTIFNGASGYLVGDVVTPAGGNYDAYLVVTSVSGTAVTGLGILYGGTGYSSGTNTTVYPPLLLPDALTLTGTLTSNVTFILAKGTLLTTSTNIVVNNNTTGAFTVTIKMGNGSGGSIGTGVVIPQGSNNSTAMPIETDGVTDVWPSVGSVNSLTVNGLIHNIGTAPTASAGSVATYSTNAGGELTGLSGATTVTITFANSGWTNAAFCTAVDSQAATPVANTSQSNTAVTFTFSSLTGNLFYHCDGN